MKTWPSRLERYGRAGVVILAIIGSFNLFNLAFNPPARPMENRLTATPLPDIQRLEATDESHTIQPRNINGWRYEVVLPIISMSPLEIHGFLSKIVDEFERTHRWIRVYAVTESPVLPGAFWIHTEPRHPGFLRENRLPAPQNPEQSRVTTV